MKRTTVAWIPIVCLLVLCAACSSSSSTSETQVLIEQFYDRLGSEDFAGALGMYEADVREALEITGGQVDESYVEWAQGETKMGKVDRIKIIDESVDTETATVKYQVVYGDGSTADRSVVLTREEGQWKLGYIDNI